MTVSYSNYACKDCFWVRKDNLGAFENIGAISSFMNDCPGAKMDIEPLVEENEGIFQIQFTSKNGEAPITAGLYGGYDDMLEIIKLCEPGSYIQRLDCDELAFIHMSKEEDGQVYTSFAAVVNPFRSEAIEQAVQWREEKNSEGITILKPVYDL